MGKLEIALRGILGSEFAENVPVGTFYELITNSMFYKSISSECEDRRFDISFESNSDSQLDFNYDVSKGKFVLWFEDDYTCNYEISLNYHKSYDGYCMCTPDNEGYDHEKNCCGTSCDWNKPIVKIVKIDSLDKIEFNGEAKDLWEIERKWKGIKEMTDIEIKEKKLAYYDEQIALLMSEKQKLLN